MLRSGAGLLIGETGAIVESLAYDAWGKRRPASTWQTPAPGVFLAAITLTPGFTMHEHLDQVGLIHMGGRVYDPELGRFLSPDPFVQFPISTQGFNRYAYVGNNPLSYTDPSGYFLKKALKIGLTIAVSYYTGLGATALWGEAAGAAVGGAVGGYLNTGSLQGAGLGALSGGVAFGVGGAFGHQLGYSEFGQLAAKSLTHGITQGLISKAGGGRFGDGALGAFAASIGGPSMARAGPGIRQAMAAAALGGTVSVIGGGKFANGAIAAAWVNMFNDQMNSRYRTKQDAEAEANALNDSGAGEIRWTTKYTGSEYGHTVMPADIAALELVLPDLAKSVFSASSTGACSMFCGAAVPVASAIFGDITNGPASDQLNASISFGNNMDRTMRVLREHPSAGVRAFTRGLERAPGSVRWALVLTAAVNNYQQCYSACTAHYLNRK